MYSRVVRVAVLAAAYMTLAPAFAAETVSIDIKLFQYKPKALDVKKGDTVVWTNGDAIEHSVTSGLPGKPTEAFDSGFFAKDGRYSHVFDQEGSFTYFCKRHPSMQATVKVSP